MSGFCDKGAGSDRALVVKRLDRQANEMVSKYLPGDLEDYLRWKREEAAREGKKQERWSRDE